MNIRQEATEAVIRRCHCGLVEVQVEIDQQTSKVRAIATGSTEIATQDLAKRVDEEEAKEIAAKSMHLDTGAVRLLAQSDDFFVYGSERGNKLEIRAVDKKGFVKLQREDGIAHETKISGARSIADKLWDEWPSTNRTLLNPDIYLCIGGRIIDFRRIVRSNQLNMLMESELSLHAGNRSVIIIGAKNDL